MKHLIILGTFALAGCIEMPKPTAEAPDGKQLFMENCASCHGTDAKGSGEMARHLIKMPPDLTQLSARNGGVFPMDDVMSTIDGLHRGPKFSGAMPEFGAGDLGQTVVVERGGLGMPVPIELLLLAEYLEEVQG